MIVLEVAAGIVLAWFVISVALPLLAIGGMAVLVGVSEFIKPSAKNSGWRILSILLIVMAFIGFLQDWLKK